MDQVKELETAILKRAHRLASEYRGRAEHSRDNILRDAHERLRLREDREVLLAKAQAEAEGLASGVVSLGFAGGRFLDLRLWCSGWRVS